MSGHFPAGRLVTPNPTLSQTMQRARAVLGIDAAWTLHEPSGVALLSEEGTAWRRALVGASYDIFIGKATHESHDEKPTGSAPNAEALLAAARRIAPGTEVMVVAVDMPMATGSITKRRCADDLVSREFGRYQCGTHSPTAQRPGRLAETIREQFRSLEYQLATARTTAGTEHRLIEVYPHPALVRLCDTDCRLPCKVAKWRKYWPGRSRTEGIDRLRTEYRKIADHLARTGLSAIPEQLSDPPLLDRLTQYKAIEDQLDAIVSAWVATKYLNGRAVPYGDDTAAIWIPAPRAADMNATLVPTAETLTVL